MSVNWLPYISRYSHFPSGFEQSYDSKGRPQRAWHNYAQYTPSLGDTVENASAPALFGYTFWGTRYENDCVFYLRVKYPSNRKIMRGENGYDYLLVFCRGDAKTKNTSLQPADRGNLNTDDTYLTYTTAMQESGTVPEYPEIITRDGNVVFRYNLGTHINSINNTGLYAETIEAVSELYFDVASVIPYNSLDSYAKITLCPSVPLFDASNPNAILAYVESGDTSGAVQEFPTDWKIYVDGKSEPLLKIVWKCEVLEEKEGAVLENFYIQIFTENENGEEITLAEIPYTEGNYNTSYLDVLRKGDPVEYGGIIEGTFRPTTIKACNLRMRLKFSDVGASSECYAYIPISGDVIYYGIAETAEDDGSTVTIIYGSGAGDDGYKEPDDPSDVEDTDSTDGYDSLGLLTTTYALTNARLQALGRFLWGGLLDSLKLVNNNPIENIVSCKIVPTLITGTSQEIVLGNVATGVNGDVVTSNVKLTLGQIAVTEFYNNFLDFSPYTKISIFIPFIGFKTLDTSLFMGKTLKVEFIIDLITGSCKALLYANNIYCQSFDGNCGVDIPITSSNRAQVETAYITGALGAIGELASGDVGGAISTGLSSAMSKYHYNTQGSYNPSCGAFETHKCYLIIDRPTFQKPSSYSHDIGNPCELTRSLNSLTGFTICDASIDLTGVQCLEDEKTEIYNLLTSGVYL